MSYFTGAEHFNFAEMKADSMAPRLHFALCMQIRAAIVRTCKLLSKHFNWFLVDNYKRTENVRRELNEEYMGSV